MDQQEPMRTDGVDPFPRMIIVCAVIAVVLLAVIFAVLLFEFIQREQEVPATPEQMGFAPEGLARTCPGAIGMHSPGYGITESLSV